MLCEGIAMLLFKERLDLELAHIKMDKSFIDTIHLYERKFVNSKEDNIIFLNNNLLGVPPFRFYDSDKDRFFDMVIDEEERLITDALHEVQREIDKLPENASKGSKQVLREYFDPESKKVSSSTINIIILYLIHRIRNSNLAIKYKMQGESDLWKIIHYRWIGSLMSNYFTHPPKQELMELTTSLLNNKFELKAAGSWNEWIQLRIDDLMSKSNIHYERINTFEFERFTDNDGISYVLTDTQGRPRSVVKAIYPFFLEATGHTNSLNRRKVFIELEDGLVIRDVIKSNIVYKDYLKGTFTSRANFIREELITVTEDMVTTVSRPNLIVMLEYFSDNYGKRGDPKLTLIVDLLMDHAMEALTNNRKAFRGGTDVSAIVKLLKALHTSPKSSNPKVLELRFEITKLIQKVTKIRNQSTVGTIKNGLIVYLLLRTFAMSYYS